MDLVFASEVLGRPEEDVALAHTAAMLAWRDRRDDQRLLGVMAATSWLAGTRGAGPLSPRPTPTRREHVVAELDLAIATARQERRPDRGPTARGLFARGVWQMLEFALGESDELLPAALATAAPLQRAA